MVGDTYFNSLYCSSLIYLRYALLFSSTLDHFSFKEKIRLSYLFQNTRYELLFTKKLNTHHLNSKFTIIIIYLLRKAEFFSSLSTYKADNLHGVLKQVSMQYPYTDTQILTTYFQHLSRRGLIQAKKHKVKSGKIIMNIHT